MKTTTQASLTALLAALALALPGCLQDGDADSPDQHAGNATSPLVAPSPDPAAGPDCPRAGKPGRFGGPGLLRVRFDQADMNQDGRLTLEELDLSRPKRFAELDEDGDGLLSPEELASSKQGLGPAPWAGAGRMGRRGDGLGPKADGSGPYKDGRGPGCDGAAGPMGEGKRGRAGAAPSGGFGLGIDADGDGKVSIEEVAAFERRWFERLDRDGDGIITKADMEQARPARRNAKTRDAR